MTIEIARAKSERHTSTSSCAALIGGAILFAVGSAALASCGDSGDATPSTGFVQLELDDGSSVTLNSIAYDISGNGFHQTGVIDVSNSTTITAVIGNIPVGTGYSIALTAADAIDPTTTCAGAATFNIMSGVVTNAIVHLQCRMSPRTGSVLVGGTVNLCPQVGTVSAMPPAQAVGSAVALSGSATDPDGVPGPLTYVWASSGGSLAPSTSANATFTCTAPGTFTATLTVGDGDCTGSAAVTVICNAAPDAGTSDGSAPDAMLPDGGGSLLFEPWPGPDTVVTVDNANAFGTNLSGLSYQPATAAGPAVLWAVQNGPSKLYQLLQGGAIWASATTDDWSAGKNLHFADGTGSPDSEGVSKAELDSPAIYVSTERDNDANTISRLSVLRFDTTAIGVDLTATNEWNLTPDLPVAGANLGLEAIAWVSDTYLVANGFLDESTGQTYDPATYANHGTGLFFVGLEANGMVYGYSLDHVAGSFHRVATIASGQISIMDLSFDRDNGALFTYCDNTCGNKATVLGIDTVASSPTRGHFKIMRAFDHPSGLPDQNNEGIAFAPESECQAGVKSFFWSDDSQTDGHALRLGSIRCGSLF